MCISKFVAMRAFTFAVLAICIYLLIHTHTRKHIHVYMYIETHRDVMLTSHSPLDARIHPATAVFQQLLAGEAQAGDGFRAELWFRRPRPR